MKKLICFAAICTVFFIVGLSIQSWAQENDGYTFMRGPMGPQVCQGRYTPPTADSVSGVCEGPVLDLVQFNAISTRLSADRLDQAIQVLEAINNRLAINNDKMQQLIEATVATQSSFVKQNRGLSETIERRFETIPEELLANDLFRQELTKLKVDILKEVERGYQPLIAPMTK